jgi:hypothetical protein
MKKKEKKYKVTLTFWIGLLIICLAIVLLFKIIVPLVLGLVYMFISLIKLYTLLDTNGKFYGGCFFLIVYFYIFSTLCNIMIVLFKYGYKKIDGGLK